MFQSLGLFAQNLLLSSRWLESPQVIKENEMKFKPSNTLLDKYDVNIKSDTVFASNARLLQSIYRENMNFPKGIYNSKHRGEVEIGNILHDDITKFKKANFFNNERIANLVKNEIKNFPEKLIKEPRIWNNLLSSQPLAFNLFGELKLESSFNTATKLFNSLFDGDVKKVTGIEFEYSPGRRNPKYLNDRSAFDVFVKYISKNDERCFFGIEVKYSENMHDSPAKTKPEYDAVANKMGIFKKDSFEALKNTSLQQLWRDHLLAGSLCKSNKDYDKGCFIITYPKDNIQCVNKINEYRKTFKIDDEKSSFFYPITLEDFIGELKKISNANWISDFYSRYLDFSIIDKM